jgi:hypothetical protein
MLRTYMFCEFFGTEDSTFLLKIFITNITFLLFLALRRDDRQAAWNWRCESRAERF